MPLPINCPSCGDGLEVSEGHRDWTVRCPACRHEFVPATQLPAAPAGGRRGRGRRDDPEDVMDDARARLAGVVSWLRGYGLLQVVFGCLGIAGAMLFAIWVFENPAQARKQAPNQDELIFNMSILGLGSVFAVVCGGLTVYGASKAARLESHGWGVAAAVLTIGSLVYCTCGFLIGIPVGAWALSVLNRPEVLDGFAAARSQYSPTEDDSPDYTDRR